ncbi:MAG TPA: hypothetical protein VLA45_04210 [Paracoccaceae bacterium]|nr:hypothetical protein [Paracoccaceae bacterium]
MSVARLYTPQLLGLTVELAAWPPIENLPLHGTARSTTCGSTVGIDLALDSAGAIDTLGLRVRACAVGQAAAAIFARHAVGKDLAAISLAHDRIGCWLEAEAPIADWPELGLLAAAREFPGRHGAILLPWKAAIAALSTGPAAS